jgi:hypothetical protein
MRRWIAALMVVCCSTAIADPPARSPEDAARLAVRFLETEVPRWHRENNCFSCHNNGDAARALFVVAAKGSVSARTAVQGTITWLERPADWKDNGGLAEASDKRLAAVQFASSLLAARRAGLSRDERALSNAATIVAGYQSSNGSWPIDTAGSVGSPATYGVTLATAVARQVLAAAGTDDVADSLHQADAWLLGQRPTRVLDAAALLLALDDLEQSPDSDAVRHCLDTLRRGEAPSGGWGPYVTSRPEPFDTALVVLALDRWPELEATDRVRRGRAFLVATQLDDGSWPETTRPANSESYAQRLSTAGWAALALIDEPAEGGE